MEFRELNRQLAKVKSSFLARKQNDFTVKGDNFTIEVTYEKTGYFYSRYMLNVKYNNYVYFQMCKDPYKVWEEMQNSIKVVEMILTDPEGFKKDRRCEEIIKKTSVNEIIGKVFGRC